MSQGRERRREPPDYAAYLLRLWQESAGDPAEGDSPLWGASLEKPQSDIRQGFASLADLFDFLAKETGLNASRSELPDENGFQPPALSE